MKAPGYPGSTSDRPVTPAVRSLYNCHGWILAEVVRHGDATGHREILCVGLVGQVVGWRPGRVVVVRGELGEDVAGVATEGDALARSALDAGGAEEDDLLLNAPDDLDAIVCEDNLLHQAVLCVA